MPKAIIIDDEVSARRDLRTLLGAHPDVTIVGEAALIDDARVLLQRDDYDLVFLDIQLLGGTGFDLVPDVRAEARIIFVTAYDQFALRAFEVNALDYLRKPLRVARLADSLRRVPVVATAPAAAEPVSPPSVPPVLRPDDLISVKTGPGATRFIRVADIVSLTSQDNYSELRLASGEHFLVRQTLTAWEERLPSTHFLRVHRQTIVSLLRIEGFSHLDEETSALRIAGLKETVRARRAHWPELRARLAALGLPAL
jgi:two-component system LytT family response regulator